MSEKHKEAKDVAKTVGVILRMSELEKIKSLTGSESDAGAVAAFCRVSLAAREEYLAERSRFYKVCSKAVDAMSNISKLMASNAVIKESEGK